MEISINDIATAAFACFLFCIGFTSVIATLENIGWIKRPETDFITFPVLCTSDGDEVLASLNLPTQSEQDYRTAFYRKSEVAGFYPHSEKGKIWVEMKNGSMCITNVRMRDFKQMIES